MGIDGKEISDQLARMRSERPFTKPELPCRNLEFTKGSPGSGGTKTIKNFGSSYLDINI
jgi:hypothetical protein